MKDSLSSIRNPSIIGIYLLYSVLTVSLAYTLHPAPDEAVFAEPAAALSSTGHLRSTMITGAEQHVYFMPPLHFVVLAAWYKVWGVTFVSTRLFVAVFGLVLLMVWTMLFHRLDRQRYPLYVLALAINSTFLVSSARGRMDLECATFGLVGISSYLLLRDARIAAAFFIGSVLTALSCLTHPNGAYYFIGFWVISFYLDRGRWSFRLLCLACAPYAAAVLAWGVYIWQDPSDFFYQFSQNVQSMGRLSALQNPLQGIYREVVERYSGAFGFESAFQHPARIAKAIPLIGLAYIPLWLFPRFRFQSHTGPILLVGGVNAVLLALTDGQKRPYYVIHFMPALSVAFTATYLYLTSRERWRKIAYCIGGLYVASSLSLSFSRIKTDQFHTEFLPAMEYLSQRMTPSVRIARLPGEFLLARGFPLDPSSPVRILDADYIVTEGSHNGDLSWINLDIHPAVAADQLRWLLSKKYVLEYDRGSYQVFGRRAIP